MNLYAALRTSPLMTLLACQAAPAPTDSGTAAGLDVRTPTAVNLVLINVDTLRADHLPMYGYAHQTLPRLSERPWRVVEGLKAGASWTAHATASLLTGLDVLDHGVLRPVPQQPERGPVVDTLASPTVAEHLRGLGFDTALFTANGFVSKASGLDRGFDEERLSSDEGVANSARRLTAEAISWLDAREGDAPFFIMLQPMDMHAPYQPLEEHRGTWQDPETLLFPLDRPEPEQAAFLESMMQQADPLVLAQLGAQLGAVYDEELLSLDDGVAALLDALETRGLLSQTLVIFTADHGESLMDTDNGYLGHGKAFTPEVLELPWMMLHPALEGGRERCLTGQLDVLPTALSAMALPPLAEASGQAMQEGCRAHALSSFYGETGLALVASWDEARMLRKSCDDGEDVWFDLEDDPYAERPRPASELGVDDPLLQVRSAWLEDNLRRYGDRSCL